MASSAHCTSASNNNGDVETPINSSAAYYEEQLAEIKDEFKSFLETYSNVLHKATTYKLVSSHGRSNELLYYASLIGDSDRVISHWIVQKEWQKALDVLTRQVLLFSYI